MSAAGADVVGKTGAVVWVTHEDGSLYSLESVASKSGACAAAECVVHDLTTLYSVSMLFLLYSLRHI